MLILTRRIGETLMIGGDEITITVLGVKGNQVRVGVKAPSDCTVDREEIFLRKQAEQEDVQANNNKQYRPAARNFLFKSKTH